MKSVIIVGSSRSNGRTSAIADELKTLIGSDVIHLTDYAISYYDYKHDNHNDDFLKLMRKVIGSYDLLIFATPVYWYSMSGIMKVFFDRITDLITIEKDLGRKLRGKSMAVITTSTGSNLGETFWLPFKESADYLGMNYLADMHTIEGEDNNERLVNFANKF